MLEEGCGLFGMHRKSLIRAFGRQARGRRGRRRGLSGTRGSRRLAGQVPIRTRVEGVEGPGSFEVDTAAHGGSSLAGAFVWSVSFTDIWSGWTENRAVWNRKGREIVARLAEIEGGLPFEIEAVQCDNGSEFLNRWLWHHFRDRPRPVVLTRSRPGRKNDNAHVEQKHWTHVRQLLGCQRLEDRRLTALFNDLYANEWRALQNFFLPTMQLPAKNREGSRLHRRHGPPCTPCERLLASAQVCTQAKEQLRQETRRWDPFDLHDAVERKLRRIFRLARTSAKGGAATQRVA